MKKPRIHNEWFQPIAKRSCECGARKVDMFAWGEYVNGKWRTILHFCQGCFQERVIPQLVSHAAGCGCSFSLQARSGHRIPSWITMPVACETKSDMREVA